MDIYLFLILVLFLLFLCACRTWKIFLEQNVSLIPYSRKLENLNRLLLPYGFQYQPDADYFYAVMDCWQRKYGYCRLYDETAPALGMIFDSEPIYFEYDSRLWLIEFWKGQYGMSSGAEVGVYVSSPYDASKSSADFHQIFFHSVDNSKLLPIKLHIYRGKKLLASREGTHWWLTMFLLGRYNPPHKLTAKISITFPDCQMLNAYVDGLKNAGYSSSAIHCRQLTATVAFARPKSAQPVSRRALTARFSLLGNRIICWLYRRLTRKFTSTLDKLTYLSILSPSLYRIVLSLGKKEKRYAERSSYVYRKPFK